MPPLVFSNQSNEILSCMIYAIVSLITLLVSSYLPFSMHLNCTGRIKTICSSSICKSNTKESVRITTKIQMCEVIDIKTLSKSLMFYNIFRCKQGSITLYPPKTTITSFFAEINRMETYIYSE